MLPASSYIAVINSLVFAFECLVISELEANQFPDYSRKVGPKSGGYMQASVRGVIASTRGFRAPTKTMQAAAQI